MTASPSALSTGKDSPVIEASLTLVLPWMITPSTGIFSPGNTLSLSPITMFSARMIRSRSPVTTRAVAGVMRTSFSMPARALAVVMSSKREPSCMMTAISPAAKVSPINTEAINAKATSTSALISKCLIKLYAASSTIGTPQRTMAIHDKSTAPWKGGHRSIKHCARSDTPLTIKRVIFKGVPPTSNSRSTFSGRKAGRGTRVKPTFDFFIGSPPYTPMGMIFYQYTRIGITCQETEFIFCFEFKNRKPAKRNRLLSQASCQNPSGRKAED